MLPDQLFQVFILPASSDTEFPRNLGVSLFKTPNTQRWHPKDRIFGILLRPVGNLEGHLCLADSAEANECNRPATLRKQLLFQSIKRGLSANEAAVPRQRYVVVGFNLFECD